MSQKSDQERRSGLTGSPRPTPVPDPSAAVEGEKRRNFLIEMIAFVTGGIIVAIPAFLGIGFALDPIRRLRRGKSEAGGGRRDEDGFLRVASLASLPKDGRPQSFTVYDDLVDAWNKFPDQPVGRVFLRRKPDGKVTAFNARCPHLGCMVDYRQSHNDYFCPCHTSAFTLDGEKENQIPPRGLDELEVKIKNNSEVWVQYKMFKAATPQRISVDA